jgi:signal transduction histidine kinase
LTKAAMKTQLVGSKQVIEKDDLSDIQQLHQEGIQSLRNLLWNISSEESTTQEFQDRITDWLTLVFDNTGIEFTFENRIPDATFNLSVQQRRQLLPIIKELATNTLKHSNGGRFRLELDMVGGKYQIMALDDGKHVDTTFTETGYGIKSIKTRVENLNGVVSFSKTNKGFKTIILF